MFDAPHSIEPFWYTKILSCDVYTFICYILGAKPYMSFEPNYQDDTYWGYGELDKQL